MGSTENTKPEDDPEAKEAFQSLHSDLGLFLGLAISTLLILGIAIGFLIYSLNNLGPTQ